MTIDLYFVPGSAPCRSVLLTAAALGVDLNKKEIDFKTGDHLKPEFLKMNPQHTIPTLNDNGFYLYESRAIVGYLVQQYGKDDTLYPKSPKARATVDQRLYFDCDVLYRRFGETYYPMLFAGAPIDEAKKEKFDESLKWLDGFLGQTKWAAGDNITIADFALVSSISTADAVSHDLKPYKNITRWYSDCASKMTGYNEITEAGKKAFEAFLKKK